MSEWKESRFSDMLVDESISYGIVQPGSHTEEDSVPIIRVNNIKNGNINTNDVLKVASIIEGKYKRTRLVGGELLITVVGNVGECAIVPATLADWNVARAVSVARIKEHIDKRFIKYAFKTEDVLFQLYGNTNDTVQPTLNLSSLKEIKIKLPTLPEQKAIASVLSSLDDKMNLLHRQNRTLESIADTLFRQWFEKSEKSCKVLDLIKVQNGYAFKSEDFKEIGTNGVIKIKNISGSIVDIYNSDFVEGDVVSEIDERFKIVTGDVLFAMTGAEIGKMGIVPQTERLLWLNQRVGLFKEKYEGTRFLAYLQLKSDFGQDYIENTATGSAQPNISSFDIENCEFPLADKNLVIQYSKILDNIYKKVIFNLGQIRKLEKIRDSLLPKLMSGEVRVKDISCAQAGVL